MRRTVSAVVAALGMCAASGAALADEVNGFEQKVITPSGLHVVSLHRYAYNFAGKKLDSERICNLTLLLSAMPPTLTK